MVLNLPLHANFPPPGGHRDMPVFLMSDGGRPLQEDEPAPADSVVDPARQDMGMAGPLALDPHPSEGLAAGAAVCR